MVDILLEALLEHLVGLVEDDGLQVREVDVVPVDVVEDSAGRAHEELNSVPQITYLVLNGDSSVHGDHLVLIFRMLYASENV